MLHTARWTAVAILSTAGWIAGAGVASGQVNSTNTGGGLFGGGGAAFGGGGAGGSTTGFGQTGFGQGGGTAGGFGQAGGAAGGAGGGAQGAGLGFGNQGGGNTGNFIGRTGADVTAGFQALGLGGQAGGQVAAPGAANRGRGVNDTQESTLPVRVRLSLGFTPPAAPATRLSGAASTSLNAALERSGLSGGSVAVRNGVATLSGVAAGDRVFASRLMRLNPAVTRVTFSEQEPQELPALNLPGSGN